MQQMPTIPGVERVFEYSPSRPQQFPLVRTPGSEYIPKERIQKLHSPIQNKKPGTSSHRTTSSGNLINAVSNNTDYNTGNSQYEKRSVSNEVGAYKKSVPHPFQHTIGPAMFKNMYVSGGQYNYKVGQVHSQLPKVCYIYIYIYI